MFVGKVNMSITGRLSGRTQKGVHNRALKQNRINDKTKLTASFPYLFLSLSKIPNKILVCQE